MVQFQARCVYWWQIFSAILLVAAADIVTVIFGVTFAVIFRVIVAVMRSSLLLVWGAGLMGRKAEWRG